jgi:hypothetical protein
MDEPGPAFLKVVILVDNTGGSSAKSSDFTIDMRHSSTAPFPSIFDGSQNGTIVAMNVPGDYAVYVLQKDGVTTP